jgi:nucleoside-diphosphate-sugar epimerase
MYNLPMVSKKTILVTGANGFLGSHLVEWLVDQGHHVKCLVRPTSNIKWLAFHKISHTIELIHGSFDDSASLTRAVADAEFIVHLAAAKAVRRRSEFYRMNADGTERLARAAGGKLERFLYVSSGAAAGPSPSPRVPLTEDQIPRPVSEYGASKLEGEQRLERTGVPFTILRPPVVYGPRDEDMLVFFRTVAKGIRPVLMGGPRHLTMLHVYDVVEAIQTALFHPRALGQTYFVGDGKGATWEQVGDLTAKLLKKRTIRLKLPVWGLFTAAALSEWTASLTGRAATLNLDKAREATHHWVFSGEKLREDTGWTPAYSLERGFRHTFEWYQQEGWL